MSRTPTNQSRSGIKFAGFAVGCIMSFILSLFCLDRAAASDNAIPQQLRQTNVTAGAVLTGPYGSLSLPVPVGDDQGTNDRRLASLELTTPLASTTYYWERLDTHEVSLNRFTSTLGKGLFVLSIMLLVSACSFAIIAVFRIMR